MLHRECQALEDLIKSMNQEQYHLLQLGREYLTQASSLKEQLRLDGFRLLPEHSLRVLTEPTSRNQTRHEDLTRQPDFVQRQIESAKEAERLRAAILKGHFGPPLDPELYFNKEENLGTEFRRLTAVQRDLDYVGHVASDHLERSKRVETRLKSLKSALGAAFSHSSQVYREVSTYLDVTPLLLIRYSNKIVALETLVAASRPIPTWKRVSNNVKPILSWGVTILTWILKFLGEIGKIIGLFIPPFLKNQFGWEMLSGSWPRFVFWIHVGTILLLRWKFATRWSFETGVMAWVWPGVLVYVIWGIYIFSGWYTYQVRYYVLNDWWEREGSSKSLSWAHFVGRYWYALLLLFGLVVMTCGLIYWLFYSHL